MKKFFLSFMAVALISSTANAVSTARKERAFSCTDDCTGVINNCPTLLKCMNPNNKCLVAGGLLSKMKGRLNKVEQAIQTAQGKNICTPEVLKRAEATKNYDLPQVQPKVQPSIPVVQPKVQPSTPLVRQPSARRSTVEEVVIQEPSIERRESVATVRRQSTAVLPQVSEEVIVQEPIRRPSAVRRSSVVAQPPLAEEVVVQERMTAVKRPGPGAGGRVPAKELTGVSKQAQPSTVEAPKKPVAQPPAMAEEVVTEETRTTVKRSGPGAGGRVPAKVLAGSPKQAQATTVEAPKKPVAKPGPSVPFSASQLAGVQLKKAEVGVKIPAPVSGLGGSFAQMNIPKVAGGETGEAWEQEVDEPNAPVVKAVPQPRVMVPSALPRVEQMPRRATTAEELKARRAAQADFAAAAEKARIKRYNAIHGIDDDSDSFD